jgi:hypothetical protein
MGKIRRIILAHKYKMEHKEEATAELERKEKEVIQEQQTQPGSHYAKENKSIADRIAEENRWLEESQKRIRANEKEEEARDPVKYAANLKAIREKEDSPEYAEWLKTREEIERIDRVRRISERDKRLKAEQELKEQEDKRIAQAIEQHKKEERQSMLARSAEKQRPPLVLKPGILPIRRSKREEIERQRQDYIKFRTEEEDKWRDEAQKRVEILSQQYAKDTAMVARTEEHEQQLVEKFKAEKEAEEIRQREEARLARQQMEKDEHERREDERIKRELKRLDDIWHHMN